MTSKARDVANSPSPVKAYLKNKPESLEDYPFGSDVAVFKVRGKMFATFSWHVDGRQGNGEQVRVEAINLKCEPNQAAALRDIFPAVIPGYHMNKKHWNTVLLDGSIPNSEIQRMIDHSYALVVKGLKKSDRDAIKSKYSQHLEGKE